MWHFGQKIIQNHSQEPVEYEYSAREWNISSGDSIASSTVCFKEGLKVEEVKMLGGCGSGIEFLCVCVTSSCKYEPK